MKCETLTLLLVPLQMFGLRGQFFVNAGNVTTWNRVLTEKKWMKNLVDDTRVSVGMGLVWGTRIGRLEANYSWVLKSHAHVRGSLSMRAVARTLDLTHLFDDHLPGRHQARAARTRDDVLIDSSDTGKAAFVRLERTSTQSKQRWSLGQRLDTPARRFKWLTKVNTTTMRHVETCCVALEQVAVCACKWLAVLLCCPFV